MKSSPHRPLILKKRKQCLPHSDASSTLKRSESGGQDIGSPEQEQARTSGHNKNKEEHSSPRISAGIKIIDHPTTPNVQVVAVPPDADIQSILEVLTAKGKESGSSGPNKFILISSGNNSPSLERRTIKKLFRTEDEHIIISNRNHEKEKCVGQSSGTMEESAFWTSESSLEGQEQEGNSSGETTSCALSNSLTNIQWLGKMSSNGLIPCSLKKETEKENQTPKQRTIKDEECSAASTSTTWQESFSERPPYSYMAMIQFAINSTEKKRMMLKDIYTWIEDHFPYFKHVAKPGWKNSIRHNLSLHDMFVRETSANGKISFWTIHPEANRYLTLDQVFKQQKRHIPDLQKNMGSTSGSKIEPQSARRKMKPLLPRVNSYLVPIQFPVNQSIILQPSAVVPETTAPGVSKIMHNSKHVRIAPKGLPSREESALFTPAVPIKEETYCGEVLSPFAFQESIKEDEPQIKRESFTADVYIKEEDSVKAESMFPNEASSVCLPAPAKQKRQFTALTSPPRSILDTLVIKRRERHEIGKSRRKQRLALPRSEEPVLLLSSSSTSDSYDLSFVQDTHPLGNMSCFNCSQGEADPFKTPVKEVVSKLSASSITSKTSLVSPPFLPANDPLDKEASSQDWSPVRTPPTSLLSLQENLDLLGFSSTPLKQSLCDSPQLPLLNAETNNMISGPLTSSLAPSKQSSPGLQASTLPQNRSFLEGLVLDTMNDSLSKILLDVSFADLDDDSLGTNLSWSQFSS
uniref:Forkhead box protein M1 n=1 Tax=Salvator merianae TaxID=96440 RepID=A0A8D0KPQ7_SALMN